MQDLPIDIHVRRLENWLVTRRHCDKDWRAAMEPVRQKIAAALQDMPEHEQVVQLISRHELNYFTCVALFELLKQTDDSSKSILGYYRSQRLKDWQDILHAYRAKNLHLSDSAQRLMENAVYKIPSLRKFISRNEQLQTEFCTKKASCLKNAKILEKQYYADCAQLGLEGNDLTAEVKQILGQLPQMLSEFADTCKPIAPAIDYYRAFVGALNESCDVTVTLLPTLSYFIDHGNVTLYEFRTGQSPPEHLVSQRTSPALLQLTRQSSRQNSADKESKDGSSDEIDWGCEIDYSEVECEDFVCVSESGNTETVESATTVAQPTQDELATLLEDSATRAKIVNDLIELDTFLTQRAVDSSSAGDSSSVLLLLELSLPELMAGDVETVRATVRAAVNQLDTARLQRLLLMNTSSMYIERLLRPVKNKLLVSQQLLAKADQLQQEFDSKALEIVETQRQLQLLLDLNKQLKRQVEEAICEKYPGRTVHIIMAT